jgi:protein LSM14
MTNHQQQQPRNNRPQQQTQQHERSNGNNRSMLKFVGDFDFEKSNAEFDKNAIEDEIKKSLSIKPTKGESLKDSPTAEHDKENHQTSSTSTQSEQQQEINLDGYYDKQKSFFDRISCESTEKENT